MEAPKSKPGTCSGDDEASRQSRCQACQFQDHSHVQNCDTAEWLTPKMAGGSGDPMFTTWTRPPEAPCASTEGNSCVR